MTERTTDAHVFIVNDLVQVAAGVHDHRAEDVMEQLAELLRLLAVELGHRGVVARLSEPPEPGLVDGRVADVGELPAQVFNLTLHFVEPFADRAAGGLEVGVDHFPQEP